MVGLAHQRHSRGAVRHHGVCAAGLTLVTLVLLYGFYALADGLTALWVGGGSRAWSFVLVGVLGVIAGILTFIYLGITAIALLYLIAVWAIVRGIFEIITAIQLRKEISNEWTLILGGIISIIFGVVLVVNRRRAHWRWYGSSAHTRWSSA